MACDELLFLPGTLHGHEHGIEGPLIEIPDKPPTVPSPPSRQNSGSPQQRSVSSLTLQSHNSCNNNNNNNDAEADLAAGGGLSIGSSAAVRNRRSFLDDENGDNSLTVNVSEPTIPKGSSGSEDDQKSWDMDAEDDDESQIHGLLRRTSTQDLSLSGVDDAAGGSASNGEVGPLQRLPRLSRLGNFFFFRSSATTTQNAAYAPSGPAVFGAALDLSMPVLFNFHLFIEAYNHMQGPDGTDAPAKILPLIFLSVLIVRTIIPPGKRLRFWGTMKFTFTAPLHHVRFRDEFIGDVVTSWVRPGQDLFFALSYYLTVIWGTLSGRYGLSESCLLLEESWLLHNVIMPSFAILPLWLKYLQTLRQAYDSNKRWPYQANSLKYLSATLVIIYAITHPESRHSIWWRLCFFLTLLYQIGWDILVDWELFELQPRGQLGEMEPDSWTARLSSFRPTSVVLLNIQMYVIQPVLDHYQRLRAIIPSWRQIQLRQKRLYKTEAFYWKILAYNTVMRFTWMLCYIPAFHVTRSRTVLTSTSDVNSYWGVMLPVAEIVRRTLWGFLFVERETIKLMDSDVKYSRVAQVQEDDENDDDADSKFGDRGFRNQLLPTWLDNQQQVAHNAATSRAQQRDVFMRQLFVFELYAWAAGFVILGCWAAS